MPPIPISDAATATRFTPAFSSDACTDLESFPPGTARAACVEGSTIRWMIVRSASVFSSASAKETSSLPQIDSRIASSVT